MPASSRALSHFVPLLFFGAVALLLSGCVYLRLLEFKKQLTHFDENFALPATEDLSLHCRHPVLQADDLRWLGASPKTITPNNGGEDWLIRWIKEPAPGSQEQSVYDMELAVRFVDGHMIDVRIPKRYLAYIPRELVLNMLRSTGTAKVDKENRKTDAQTEAPAATPMPNLSTVKSMLGEPTRRQETSGLITHFYRYRLDSAADPVKPIEAAFTFDAATGELRKFTARLPRGTLNYDFKPTPLKP